MKYLKLFEDFDPFSHLKIKRDEPVPETRELLEFTLGGNDKIDNPYLALPAGWTCKNAGSCKSMSVINLKTGRPKLKSFGDMCCYAASDENRLPYLRKRNWRNLLLLIKMKTKENMIDLIDRSFNYNFRNPPRKFRIHESGDYDIKRTGDYAQNYFDAWLEYAKKHPETIFYGFTTSLDLWVKRLSEMPNNFRLTASVGGKLDHLIEQHNLRWCMVVPNVEEAIKRELPVDIDDTLASSDSKEPFCILLHGKQKAGSPHTADIKKNKELINQLRPLRRN